MRIGELAELAGVTTRTVRHYHRLGLLPEPERRANGYREYGLDDAVLLLRVRRLVELGLTLDEVADALAGADGTELREILTELDEALGVQEQRIRARRQRIGDLLADEGDPRVPVDARSALEQLERVAGSTHPAMRHERLIAELIEPLTGDAAPHVWQAYHGLVADQRVNGELLDAYRRFDELASLAPGDPAVDALAREVAGLGAAVRDLLPDQVLASDGDPAAGERLVATVTAGMPAAQARCVRLMVGYWQESTR